MQVSKLIHAPRKELTQEARGEVAVRKSSYTCSSLLINLWTHSVTIEVAASKAIAIEAALEASSKIFEVMGASSSLTKYGFDRFFRNTRGKRFLLATYGAKPANSCVTRGSTLLA